MQRETSIDKESVEEHNDDEKNGVIQVEINEEVQQETGQVRRGQAYSQMTVHVHVHAGSCVITA